jgi:Transposase, Mutator family
MQHNRAYREETVSSGAKRIESQVVVWERQRSEAGPARPTMADIHNLSSDALGMESCVNGVSTRKVERVVEQLGIDGMSKSQVSRMCAGLDERVTAFRERPLEGRYPYLWLDAKVEKVRDPDGRVLRKALVVAYAVHEHGYREVIALDVGATESKAFWREFLRSLVARGLHGVDLVVSDQHEGPRSRAFSPTPRTIWWPSTRCRPSTGRSSEAPTRWSASTVRSAVAPTLSSLPQRRRPASPGGQFVDRAKRRLAGRPTLSIRGLDGTGTRRHARARGHHSTRADHGGPRMRLPARSVRRTLCGALACARPPPGRGGARPQGSSRCSVTPPTRRSYTTSWGLTAKPSRETATDSG